MSPPPTRLSRYIRSAIPRPRCISRKRDSYRLLPRLQGRVDFGAHPRRFDMPRHDLIDRRCALLAAGGALMLGLWPARAPAQTGGKSKIGVIGSGKIGGTIGGLWVKAGHPVLFSSRHPEQLKDMVDKLGAQAQAGSVEQAIAFGDVLFVAVPYGALPQIGK